MTDYTKLPEPELEIQYFDKNVLWIGASGASSFSEGETLAQGLVLEYDREGTAVGVVLTRSALNKLKEFLDQNITEHPGTHQTWNSSKWKESIRRSMTLLRRHSLTQFAPNLR